MNEPTPIAAPASSEQEVARLRARVVELEAQLAEQARATNELVARSQEKLYWLERWHVDLDRLMAKPGAQQLLEVVKGVRTVVRMARTAKRKVLG
jgi:uncharacterized coiled-coil protein SlyX